MHAKPAIVALATSAMLGSSSWARTPVSSEGIGGIYAGSYQCGDGEHGVVLDLKVDERPQGRGLKVTGTLGFFPVLGGREGEFAHVAGSFSILGLIAENGRITFQHREWLLEPDGYGAANFNGRINQRDDGLWQITGKPLAGPNSDFCSDLIATQFLPRADPEGQ